MPTLSPDRVKQYHQDVDRIEDQAARLAREQGFISAAERSSFHRSLDSMLKQLANHDQH
jgi:hypothetical protein